MSRFRRRSPRVRLRGFGRSRSQLSACYERRGELAFSSLQDLVDDDGNLLPIKEWPQDAAAAVSSVELTKRNLVAGDGAQENVVKIRLWDKPANVQILMKHLGLLTDQVDHKHSGRFELVWAEDE